MNKLQKHFYLSITLLITCMTVACTDPVTFEIRKGEVKESEEPYNLTQKQIKYTDEAYIAIRDKDETKMKQIFSEFLLNSMSQDPTALIELSSYIPYYEKLVSKRMIEFIETTHTEHGELLQAIFRYEYENSIVYYRVIFKKNDPQGLIWGIHLDRQIKE